MLRGWLALLAVFAGVSLSFAADSTGALLVREKQWEEARTYLADGKPAEAKAAFEALLTRYPGEPDLHLFLGITLLRLRDPRAAEQATRQAIALDPSHIEARTLLGWIESEIHGDFDAAVEQYSKVVELRPDSWEAHNNLGVAFKRKGDPVKAAASFTHALKLRPDYGAAWSNRGWVFAQQNKWREAREDFAQALRLDPGNDGALYGLSQVLREARDYAGAQQALSQLISRSPNFVYWLEWGRVGLIRYYWVGLLIALAIFLNGRFHRTRKASHGG